MNAVKKPEVVIIDDDEMVNEVLKFILDDEYRVYNYYTAEDALQSDVIMQADVIVTDVNLPGINGLEFIQKVHEINESIPIIIITAYNDIEIAISALKAGAFDFILKPFKNDQIALAVKRAYERYKLIKENINLVGELKLKNNELEKLYAQLQTRSVQIENELDIASNLQQCLFPISFPEIKGFSFYLKFKPVEKISGDFFDFIIHDGKHFSFIFADVSGHGVPAALYSAIVKTAISSIVTHEKSPSEIMNEMNQFLIQTQKTMSYNYAAIFLAHINLDNHRIEYINAGLPAPIIIHNDGDAIRLGTTGPFVGIFDTSLYTTKSVKLLAGDKLLFFSDGAFECPDKVDRILGEKQFQQLIDEYRTLEINELIEFLFKRVQEFCGYDRFVDDVTMLGMKYEP